MTAGRIHQGNRVGIRPVWVFCGLPFSRIPVLPTLENILNPVQCCIQFLAVDIVHAIFDNVEHSSLQFFIRIGRRIFVETAVIFKSHHSNHNSMQSSFADRCWKRCNTGRFDTAVYSGMIRFEMFIMRFIPGAAWTVKHKHNTGSIRGISTDTACCLDIFRSCFRLTGNSHQAEPWYIKANRNHVCCKAYIDRMFFNLARCIFFTGVANSKIGKACSNFTAGNTTGKFFVAPDVASALAIFFLCRIALIIKTALIHDIQMLINIRPNPCGSLSEFADAVIISDICPIGISVRFFFNFHCLCPIQQRCK